MRFTTMFVFYIRFISVEFTFRQFNLIEYEFQGGDGFQHYKVRARLAVFNKQFKEAESIYLEGVSFVLL